MTNDNKQPGVPYSLKTVIQFLLGEGEMDGMWFGDTDTDNPRPRYWWRSHLRAALQSPSVANEVASTWWSVIMEAAASLEDASYSIHDPEAKRAAEGACSYARKRAHQLWATSPQPPAQDDSELVETLRNLIRGYVNTLENGRDRIMQLGGDCDPVEVMESSDPYLREARAAIASHTAKKAK